MSFFITLTYFFINKLFKKQRNIYYRHISATSSSKLLYELPPSLMASMPFSLSFINLTLSGKSSFTESAKTLASFPESGTESLFSPTRTATPKSSTSSFALLKWSACIGHASITTPPTNPSRAEPQPKCVRYDPTVLCSRIIVCGAHPLMIKPFSLTLSSNPSGITSSSSSPELSPELTFLAASLTAHMKRTSLVSKAAARAAVCSTVSRIWLPKAM
ncbi:hypothetical protein N665_1956s0008 [Sinapis alba]|nr:hypothetical protein N665_1956s0008 [Sinapis alba]